MDLMVAAERIDWSEMVAGRQYLLHADVAD